VYVAGPHVGGAAGTPGCTVRPTRLDFDPEPVTEQVSQSCRRPQDAFEILGGPDGSVLYSIIVTSAAGGQLIVQVGPDGAIGAVDPGLMSGGGAADRSSLTPMATYGPGGSRRASKHNPSRGSSSRSSTVSTRPGGSRAAASRDNGRDNGRDNRRDNGRDNGRDGTDSTRRMDDVAAGLRGAMDGRENEFMGIALVAAGILLALAIYFNLAGPLGRGVETLVGWFTGSAGSSSRSR
jgi:hypothetical protein